MQFVICGQARPLAFLPNTRRQEQSCAVNKFHCGGSKLLSTTENRKIVSKNIFEYVTHCAFHPLYDLLRHRLQLLDLHLLFCELM